MSLRVNLMHESEGRYQGPVSFRFIAMSSGGFVAGILIIWVVFMLRHSGVLREEVSQLSDRWNSVQPQYKAALQKRAEFSSDQALLKELKSWSTSRLDWAARFDEINGYVPPSIQLTRLSIQSEWTFMKPAPPPAPASDTAEAKPDSKPKSPPPAQLARKHLMSISGRAEGDAGSDDVVQMVKQLKASPGYSEIFDTIKLQNLVREARPDDRSDRSFAIEGVGLLRKME